ncbi:VIT1/CCC1 transporter family protein [Bradyrhizobium ontarionense]|uniref:VIT1/CCC1 transporter family protein n=1 Tax=Bradyrhizobium ontarionense TaxID=2898149 RepID=A0ABY3RAS4_9BRAD|nr:VIT1/CCC1 transporter family protein [Bradyrhizobium sp. A19]UFZ04479.1 VIT1/CCC1 transporter family protein [Bradyrhizobium sp. A19]
MPATPHLEKHFTATEAVRDVVIGMADGLTVPFALAAGLSAAITTTSVIVTAGLAEVVAGAIAMGLGGYLAARTDAEHYAAEEKREHDEIEHLRGREVEEVAAIFRGYGLEGQALTTVVESIASDRKRWVDFMMRFELGLERPDPKRAPVSALTIGGSYVIGGLIPLIPYMLTHDITSALRISVVSTGLALLVFGAIKGHFTGASRIKSALQTVLVGGLAAGAAFWLAHLFG